METVGGRLLYLGEEKSLVMIRHTLSVIRRAYQAETHLIRTLGLSRGLSWWVIKSKARAAYQREVPRVASKIQPLRMVIVVEAVE